MTRKLPRGVLAAVLATISAIALNACDPAGAITGIKDAPLTPAVLSGKYRLASVASACDVMISGVVKEGGTFTARNVEGIMTFLEDGTVEHDFRIVGTCAFPEGTRSEIDQHLAYGGKYRITGSRSVELNHGGVLCTARYEDGAVSVRTGSLFPPVRFTYQLEKSATATAPVR